MKDGPFKNFYVNFIAILIKQKSFMIKIEKKLRCTLYSIIIKN